MRPSKFTGSCGGLEYVSQNLAQRTNAVLPRDCLTIPTKQQSAQQKRLPKTDEWFSNRGALQWKCLFGLSLNINQNGVHHVEKSASN